MKWTLCALVLVAVAALGWASGKPTHFATVTYTLESGQTWTDSGNLVSMHAMPSSVPGYNLIVFDFTDHSDVFHLDDGDVGLSFR